MRRTAIPHLEVECYGHQEYVDMNIELYGTGRLDKKYERALEKFFKTDDKREMMLRALRWPTILVLRDNGEISEIDRESGHCIRRVGNMNSKETKMNNGIIADKVTESVMVEGQKRNSAVVGIVLKGREAAIAKRLAREGKMTLSVTKAVLNPR